MYIRPSGATSEYTKAGRYGKGPMIFILGSYQGSHFLGCGTIPTPTGAFDMAAPSAEQFKPDAAIFFGYFLAGIAAAGVPKGQNGETWESWAREAYQNFRHLMTWVNTGQADKDYDARCAREKAIADKQAEAERRDAEGAAALLASQRAKHGEKAPVAV